MPLLNVRCYACNDTGHKPPFGPEWKPCYCQKGHAIRVEREAARPLVYERTETIARLEASGDLVPGCPGCADHYRAGGHAFAPRHKASETCRSGKHSHCSCDTCF